MGPGARTGALALVTVEAPFHDFLAFWAQARERPPPEQAELWERLYAGRHPALFAHYQWAFGEAGPLEDALPRYDAVAGDLEARFAALELETSARTVDALLATSGPVRAFALVGTFTADAWTDGFEGEVTAFFALEQIPSGERARLLALHELVHAAHARARGGVAWPDGTPALDLLQEGVAVAATRALAPELPPEQHFGVRDFAAWQRDCDAAWPALKDELLARLDVVDRAAQARFFWPDWGRPDRDVPERCGYYAAGRVIDALLEEHDLPAVARWQPERVIDEVRGALPALD